MNKNIPDLRNLNNVEIIIVGLGYVGLPLAVEFGKKYNSVGVDINPNRIRELKTGFDRTREIESDQIKKTKYLSFSESLPIVKNRESRFFIVSVPTPINKYKKPELGPLLSASKAIGEVLEKGDVVIFESTVYPGCTEEDCVPILEKFSGLVFNKGFYCGYSPERINPGDKVHTVTKIKKVTSGSTPFIAELVDELYSSVIEAGTFKAASIKVAEAAKVIENCQRDINIAFVNELALIFNTMDIDTQSVLEAAGTKWNFLAFKPGLVGGHCIGVDPYYLTYKAESLGYHSQVILSGRRINDNMGIHVASEVIKLLIKSEQSVKETMVLVLGITFKENCPDIRNTKVIDIIEELEDYGTQIDVFDPWADKLEVKEEYNIELVESVIFERYQGIVLAVNHIEFSSKEFIDSLRKFEGIIYDVKGGLDRSISDKRL